MDVDLGRRLREAGVHDRARLPRLERRDLEYRAALRGEQRPILARIVDPLFDGITTGRHVWDLFLKDYKPAPW